MESERKRILLVDDDASCRQQGRAVLKDYYEVFPMPSAEKLFEILGVFIPDLILLDIQMPEMDGFEVIKRLKSDERFAQIPVIFLTASSDKDTVLKVKHLGAVGFITKPFNASLLKERIDTCFAISEKSNPQENSEGKTEPANDCKPVILAIDDAPDILKTVHTMLREFYKVYTLPKPNKLEEFLTKTKPDLFLVDYQMPGINGFDLIPIIRGFPEHKTTPVIFLTGEGTIENINAAIELGACDFIVKPFERYVIRKKVAKHLGIEI